jgi:hypothetical protein
VPPLDQCASTDRAYRDLQAVFKRLGHERSVDAVTAASNWGKLKADAGDILGATGLIESALRAGQPERPGEARPQHRRAGIARCSG